MVKKRLDSNKEVAKFLRVEVDDSMLASPVIEEEKALDTTILMKKEDSKQGEPMREEPTETESESKDIEEQFINDYCNDTIINGCPDDVKAREGIKFKQRVSLW